MAVEIIDQSAQLLASISDQSPNWIRDQETRTALPV